MTHRPAKSLFVLCGCLLPLLSAAPAWAGVGPPVIDYLYAPTVFNCSPLAANRAYGSGFVLGATVTFTKVGQRDIEAINVSFCAGETTILRFDIPVTGAAPGFWDVVVTNPDQQTGTLPGGLEILQCVPLVIDSISPNRIIQQGSWGGPGGEPPLLEGGIWIRGTDLVEGGVSSLTLRRDDWPDLTVSQGSGGPDLVFFNMVEQGNAVLSGAPLGFYDVILTRFDGESATVVDGLEIVADPGLKIRRIGAWGGAVNAIEVDPVANLAYVGSGVSLLIFDVADPANPLQLGSVMLDGVVMGLAVRDGYAYVGAMPPGWFYVVDVSDPTAPVVVSNVNSENNASIRCCLESVFLDSTGQIAFVDPSQGSLVAFDVSDPANPVFIGECGGENIYTIFGELFLGVYANTGWVSVLEAPALGCDLVLLGSVIIPELVGASSSLSGLALSGNYLYVTARKQNPSPHSLLFVVDVSDPTAPVHVGTWGDPADNSLHLRWAVAAADGRLYWAGHGLGDFPLHRSMLIFDITTDPTMPALLGEYTAVASFFEIEVVGTTAYLGDGREGFTIVDCSDPANPVRLWNYHSPMTLRQVALDSGLLYVTDDIYGVSILDVSDPRQTSLVGTWETGSIVVFDSGPRPTQNWGIAVRDDLAYVAAGYAGLHVLDVTNPAAPTLAGEFSPWPQDVRSGALTLSPNEPIVHVGTLLGASGFLVNFDVSDLANIVDVGSVFLGNVLPLTIARGPDGIGYVALEDDAVKTVDLSVAATPLLLGTTAPNVRDLALDGNLLFSISGSAFFGGFDVSSVATPDHLPVVLAHFGSGSRHWAGAVAVHNSRAYVGTRHGSLDLLVLDVTDPASPVVLALAANAGARPSDLIVDGPIVQMITIPGGSSSPSGAGVLTYLVYVPGDFDDDGLIDELDFNGFESCFTGPGSEPADATCLIFDFDEDSDIDCDDWTAFQAAWSGPGEVPTFIPCDGLPADINGDGAVDVLDLIDLLLCFGVIVSPGNCDQGEDINSDGVVNVLDLIDLLLAFGQTSP